MAIVHNELPNHAGERRVAERLAHLPDEHLNLWFSIGYLPGVREIDTLIYHPQCGFVIVEIKAVPLDLIEEYGFNRCTIQGRKPDSGPVYQAHDAFEQLRRYLQQRIPRPPYFTTTACWPNIRRADWNARWDNDRVTGSYAESLIFREDVEGGPEVLIQRLKRIADSPPLRSNVARGPNPKVSPDTFELIRKNLLPIARPKPTESEAERLRRIEDDVRNEVRKEYPPGEQRRVVFTGLPGTGKTFRLLQIGLWHSAQGCRVLFSCFNKTLAADIRRLLQLSARNQLAKYPIVVHDVFELTSHAFDRNSLAVNGVDPDEWGKLVVASLETQVRAGDEISIDSYDTILIDEAQDMADWQLRLLELHQAPRATVCAAHGQGQELYEQRGDTSEWRSSLTEKRLRRNFRNARKVYFAAHAFFDAYPDSDAAIQRAVNRFLRAKDKELSFAFDGRGSTALRFASPERVNAADGQADFMVAEYGRVLAEELDALLEGGNRQPIDLLVLVPTEKGANAEWARQALDGVCRERKIEFIDYTREELRRVSPNNHQVRLCTFHSARGLEGAKVVLLGFEVLKNAARDEPELIRNLGFVALSRAIFDSVVVVRPELSSLPVVQLLSKISLAENTV